MSKTPSLRVMLAAMALGACTTGNAARDCTMDARFGLLVTVRDGSGQAICDAVVIAVDGGYSETLVPNSGGPNQCSYSGALERKGTYALTATAAGGSASLDDVRVQADDCHVVPATVTITL